MEFVPVSSCYSVGHGGALSPLRGDPLAQPLATLVHAQWRGLLLSDQFPCLGGTSAIRTERYRFALYPELGSAAAIRDCVADLAGFQCDAPAETEPIAVHVAVFDGPVNADEKGFERDLWRQLQGMHRADRQRSGIEEFEPVTLNETDDGIWLGDRTYFVVGLHPAASRWARRFAWPTLVFNALSHDALLRRRGQYERMQSTIRRRDTRLQGAPNPAVDRPQLAQFAGRDVERDWQCPVEVNPA
jgi:FPC/CPF motif-containing protein YcgG